MPNTTPYTVLFLCKENAGRSLMAEAMLKKLGHGRFEVYSAGIKPLDEANPVAMQILKDNGFNTEGLYPKHYSVFLEEDAPHLDFVFTLCADSAEEAKLNIWDDLARDTITAHWHFPDPSLEAANSESEHEEYTRVEMQLAQRIKTFMMLPDDKLNQIANPDNTL